MNRRLALLLAAALALGGCDTVAGWSLFWDWACRDRGPLCLASGQDKPRAHEPRWSPDKPSAYDDGTPVFYPDGTRRWPGQPLTRP